MTQTLDTLVQLLSLEPLEENLFRGASHDLGFRQLFGGQVLGQAISAAYQTVEERPVHSLHGYFLRPGDAQRPVIYQVERLRDGASFSTRRVSAIQKGKTIFSGIASFQQAESGFTHQPEMPQVPDPDSLADHVDLIRQVEHLIPPPLKDSLVLPKALQMRPVIMQNPLAPAPQAPIQQIWIRSDGELPELQALHRYLLAYASDFLFVTTSLLPHGVTMWQPDMQVASLDHAIWFHRDVRADDWLLYSMESPWAGQGRGLARGHFFNRAGELVASVAQEGLMRRREDWA